MRMKTESVRSLFGVAMYGGGVLLLLAALGFSACKESGPPAATQQPMANTSANTPAAEASATPAAGGLPVDTSKYDAEIARLEVQAEKSPGDDAARISLSKAYLRRADALRGAQQYREALRDYQSALRLDPDNEEVQKKVAEVSLPLESETTGEYGEPAPLPITPGATGAGEDAATSKEKPGRSPKKP